MFKISKNYIKLLGLIVISLIYTCQTAFAQEITAINFNGDLIGKVIPDGTVVSYDNDIIGNITADSLIIDESGQIIGGIVPQGVVIGNDNKPMGHVNNDGAVRLASGKIIGKVLPNGLVVDDNYEVLGSVLFPGLIYNDEGKTVGRLTGDGSYISFEGQNIGFVSADGYAYRNNGVGYVLDGRLISAKMVVSEDGNFIGSVAPGGKVTDFEANEIGRIHANGFVYDANRQIIGRIVNSGYAFDNQGQYLGLVSYNGEVLNKGKTVGRYRSDGQIVNNQNEVIGFMLDIAATASDLNGRYLGRLLPDGKIVKAQEQIGTVGPRGKVIDGNGRVIGQMTSSGPVFDYLGNITAQALRNSSVISLSGSPLGYLKGRLAYDNIGRILGAVPATAIAIDANNNLLGISGIGSELQSRGQKYKLSPFGYVFSTDNILSGHNIDLTALYHENGTIGGYISPMGSINGVPQEKEMKLTQFGIGLLPSDQPELFSIDALFALDDNGENIGILGQNNQIFDTKGKQIATILPEYKIVNGTGREQMPIIGSAGNALMAIGINGNMLGYADSDGEVKDYSGNKIGKVLNGSLVLNGKNAVIGKLMSLNGIVNNECSFLGVLGTRGKVRNNRDIVLGSILTNGQVISEVGSFIGYGIDEGTVIDYEGKNFGVVNALGRVLNYNNEDFGCIRWNGKLYDDENALIGRRVIPAPTIDFENQIGGRILRNGRVIDNKSKVIGFIAPDDTVIDDTKQTIGMAFRYQFAYDNDNVYMGRVNERGQVVNAENKELATVRYDGAVVADNQVIGYALYDFYIYNENGQAIGYLLSDGTVANFSGGRIGKADKGFLVDRNFILIGRGNRDYVVREPETHHAVGELMFNGDLINAEGRLVGTLAKNGEIVNDNNDVVAKAHRLQYYDINKPEQPKPANWANNTIRVEPIEVPEPAEPEEPSGFSLKSIGIALTPDGNYLGDILSNNNVIDKNGNVIGAKMPDGLIIDGEGNLIGIEEIKKSPTEQMFVPAGTFGPGSAYGTGNMPTNLGPGGGFGPGERYDPVRSAALAAAQAARRSEIMPGSIGGSKVKKEDFDGIQDSWENQTQILSSWRVDMSEMILADKPIPAVLARTLSSAGEVPPTAIVERNVYAEDGRNIVIPAGSRIIGESTSVGGGGGESSVTKVNISWKRLIRPDGSAFEFSTAKTGDAQGRGGVPAYVDQQLLKKYSLPVLTSLMSSAIAYVTATDDTTGNNSSDGDSTENSKQQAANDARQNFISQMDQIFGKIIELKSQIQPAVYVPAGTRMIIYPGEDLWIRTIERSQKETNSINNQKPEILLNDNNPTGGNSPTQNQSGSSGNNSGSTSGVVYGDDDVDVEPATPLIESKPRKKKASSLSVPPVTTTGATPPPPSTSSGTGYSSASDEQTPQLF